MYLDKGNQDPNERNPHEMGEEIHSGNRRMRANTMPMRNRTLSCQDLRTLERFHSLLGEVVKCFVPGNVYTQGTELMQGSNSVDVSRCPSNSDSVIF